MQVDGTDLDGIERRMIERVMRETNGNKVLASGRSRGFGSVEMASREEGEAAIGQFNGKSEGRKLTAFYSR